ncbi:MAG: alpha-L-fucosidase [Prevotella sp.]|nr:alpha-L-fucosidase [Prevotella sp.]
MKITCALCVMLLLSAGLPAQTMAPAAILPVPTEHQVELMKMGTYAFIHFGPNTFQNREWGYGDAEPSVFNPDTLDCDQWVRTLQGGGMGGVIFTAKHHDGFCMWPSYFTDYTIRHSPYRHGYGNAVGELATACKRQNMRLGLYLSPWDRHQANYGQPGYVEYYRNQLNELLLNYKNLFEIWFDGANGGDGYYGGARETRTIDRQHYYQFDRLFALVNKLQPQAIIHTDGGPGNRWVGNENGEAGETNWAFLTDAHAVAAGVENYETVLLHGDADGTRFVPAEVDVSIRRPDWFWNTTNESKVLTSQQLVDLFYKSVGRNATFLLNVPVNIRGKISAADSTSLAGYYRILQSTFRTNLLNGTQVTASNVRGDGFAVDNVISADYDRYWATSNGVITATLTFVFPKATMLNRVMLQEYIPLGQRVRNFTVEYLNNGQWTVIPSFDAMTTIGFKRLLRLYSDITTTSLRIRFTDARGPLCISAVGAYMATEE